MLDVNLHVTLWPSLGHFFRFANDPRIAGIRLNSAMISNPMLEKELELLRTNASTVPLYFDVKGRQLRVTEVLENPDCLDIRLNHPVSVKTPADVLFKAGADYARLIQVYENGHRLVFDSGPRFKVREGESLCIRDASLRAGGDQFTKVEFEKIEQVRKAGFKHYYLSYVNSQRDVDEFVDLVGRDAEIKLKIEDEAGLWYVANEFRKRPNLTLVAAQGDLYVELNRPHEILNALRLIIAKDPNACVGSRILLSVAEEPILRAFYRIICERPEKIDYDELLKEVRVPGVPSCADWQELAWLYDIGYRSVLICDEMCLHGSLLATTVNAFECFQESYKPGSSPWMW